MLKWLRANTLGTLLFTRRFGVEVGQDELGNRYFRERGAKDWRSERRWGLLLGALLFLAFWLQIEGLARTSSNRNAFVTGLNVLVVPIIAMAALGRRYGWRLWAACALACAGMALMFHENEPWNLGDSLTLASTVFYAIYILTLE